MLSSLRTPWGMMTILFEPSPLRKLSCQGAIRLSTRSLEGALSFVEGSRYQFHLDLCSSCRVHHAQLKLTASLLHRLPKEPVCQASRQFLLNAFQARTAHSC
jgi:hypothetical protein